MAARADDVFLYASALAFYGLISVAPLVVVALWVASLLVSDAQVHDIADGLARFAPTALGADRAFERIADLGTGLGLLAVGAALWPATAYGSALASTAISTHRPSQVPASSNSFEPVATHQAGRLSPGSLAAATSSSADWSLRRWSERGLARHGLRARSAYTECDAGQVGTCMLHGERRPALRRVRIT